jgi:hypothetical protein
MRAPPDERRHTEQSVRPILPAEAAGRPPLLESPEGLWRPPPDEMREEETRQSDQQSLIFAAIIATVIGAMALIGLREKIVRIAPRAAAPYAAVGLPVNIDGLAFADVRSRVEMEGTRKALVVEGEIVNLRRDANSLPPLALSVRGADGQDKYAWTTRAPKPRLEGGEKVAFRARLAAPPEDGAEVLVRFARNENDFARNAGEIRAK